MRSISNIESRLNESSEKKIFIRIETSLHRWISYFLLDKNRFNNSSHSCNDFSNRLCYGKLKSANIQYGLTYLISNLSFRHTTSFEITTNNHDSYFIYMIKVLQKG
ncbi:MAG TPA: hypothetical protein VFN30_06175, partial [Chitinophagaceae bacterium]|nr:hypothetical protein [Chitinophagaceae bacterium]